MKNLVNESQRWYFQAKDDYLFVCWVKKEGVFFDKGCFLAQQSGEKILKACLYASGKRRIWGHSLFEMAQELLEKDKTFAPILDPTRRLDRFYITARYPNGLPGSTPCQVYTKDDLNGANNDLKTIFFAAEQFLKNKGITC